MTAAGVDRGVGSRWSVSLSIVVVSPACDSIISGQGTRIVPDAGADSGVNPLWRVCLPMVVVSPACDGAVGG